MLGTKFSTFSIGSALLWMGLQGLAGAGAIAGSPTLRTSKQQVLAQTIQPSEKTPQYLPVAPPPLGKPLPQQRQQNDQNLGRDYRISALQPDSEGNLWVGSWQGLAKINPTTGQILARISLPNTTIGALAQDKVGRIWVGTYDGLVRLDPRTGQITAQNFFLPSNKVLSLLIDRRGFLWVGTDNGLSMVSPDQGLLMTTVKNLPGVSANALTLDARGNLWVGTLDGLVQIDTASALIMRRVTNLPGTTIQALTTRFEVFKVRKPVPQKKQPNPRQIARTPARSRPPGKPRKPAKPKPQFITVTIVKSYLWVGTPSSLFALNPETGQIRLTAAKLQGTSVTDLQLDRSDRLWAGTINGLFRVNPLSGTVEGEIAANLPSRQILSLSPDTGGKLWVGTSQGLAWVSMQTFRTGVHQTFIGSGRR
ncbi:transcriptional regulator [Kovacikia minuta CCNUW1]|uniref:ligand-binding sensor domain-containing protein n=1 Tax=Kovacikia minuta TaxID=2931930 RepID=UPI001CCA62C1|nr:two-component regulator propeller domain-containing protein [Kovacikia minuta]UBF24874.1 transcriptional regulator [Kovacikia minuta CCNUW1]